MVAAPIAAEAPRWGRGPRPAGPGTLLALSWGVVLLGAAALGGLFFSTHPGPDRLDMVGDARLAADGGAPWAHHLVQLGSVQVLVGGVVVIFLIGLTRDWLRALACAASPLLTVAVVQYVAKPLVDRSLGGAPSYPSGTVAAVAALATAAYLVLPALAKPVAALAGAAAIVGVCAAVVVLRWHYPSDAAGGALVGIGAVLTVDALAHVGWTLVGSMRRARRPSRAAPGPPERTLVAQRVGGPLG